MTVKKLKKLEDMIKPILKEQRARIRTGKRNFANADT